MSNSNETHQVTSSIYISYNLLLEGSEHKSTSMSHVLDCPPVQCLVSVLSHSGESCGTCFWRPEMEFKEFEPRINPPKPGFN